MTDSYLQNSSLPEAPSSWEAGRQAWLAEQNSSLPEAPSSWEAGRQAARDAAVAS